MFPVFNLANNIDVEMTKQKMEQYQRDNRDVIQRNKAKLVSASVCVCVSDWADIVLNPNDRFRVFVLMLQTHLTILYH